MFPEIDQLKKRASERPWEETRTRRRPKDGDRAEVRQKDVRQALILVFREHPVDRWESLDGRQVYDFESFSYWRRI